MEPVSSSDTKEEREDVVTRRVNRVEGWRLLVLLPVAVLLRLWCATLRFRFEGEAEQVMRDTSRASVIIFWHNRLLASGEAWMRYRKKRKMAGLVSASKDGAWLAGFFRLLGILSVRGSANLRGSQAVRDLVALLHSGVDVAVTPDGSRGPVYKVKRGSLVVAQKADAPVKLFSTVFTKALRFRTWDGFYLPLPFSRVIVRGEQWANTEALAALDAERGLAEIVEGRLMAMTEDLPMPARNKKKPEST